MNIDIPYDQSASFGRLSSPSAGAGWTLLTNDMGSNRQGQEQPQCRGRFITSRRDAIGGGDFWAAGSTIWLVAPLWEKCHGRLPNLDGRNLSSRSRYQASFDIAAQPRK